MTRSVRFRIPAQKYPFLFLDESNCGKSTLASFLHTKQTRACVAKSTHTETSNNRSILDGRSETIDNGLSTVAYPWHLP
jgi:hypothetical protein